VIKMCQTRKIYIGSKNPAKVKAIEQALAELNQHLQRLGEPQLVYEPVIGLAVPSSVASQPLSEEETLQGAINRAYALHRQDQHSLSFGLEGGIQLIGEMWYLSNWGALVDEHGRLYTAGGVRIPLPAEISGPCSAGQGTG
jgi:non-canonical (house-cleaning) NTP pyrophosphatase